MKNARGVFFNAVPVPLDNKFIGQSVLSISGTVDRDTNTGVSSAEDAESLLTETLMREGILPLDPEREMKLRSEPLLFNPRGTSRWPVRDQGKTRGTCVPFAALATFELARALRQGEDAPKDYSEDFLYAKARVTMKDLGPEAGSAAYKAGATYLLQSGRALAEYGVCTEETLPYRFVRDEPGWTADVSTAALNQAQAARPHASLIRVTMDIEREDLQVELDDDFPPKFSRAAFVRARLGQDTPVAATLPVFSKRNLSPWTTGSAWRSGVIPDPPADALADGQRQLGHAICIVGEIDDPDAPGGGWFIFRNSWGTRFGYRRPQSSRLRKVLAPGYGAISVRHIDVHCWGMMALYEGPLEQ